MAQEIFTGTAKELKAFITDLLIRGGKIDDNIVFSVAVDGEGSEAFCSQVAGMADYKEKYPVLYKQVFDMLHYIEWPSYIEQDQRDGNWYVRFNDGDGQLARQNPIATKEDTDGLIAAGDNIVDLFLQVIAKEPLFADCGVQA